MRRDTNFLLSYPRSGSHWLKERIKRLCAAADKPQNPNDYFAFTHFGHAANSSINFPGYKYGFPPGSQIVVLIREAKQVLASHFHQIKTILTPAYGVTISDDPNAFATGRAGVGRLCEFMNDVHVVEELAESKMWTVRFLHYEDLFRPESLHVLRGLLGLQVDLSADRIARIMEGTRGLAGPVGIPSERGTTTDQGKQLEKWRRTLSQETGDEIDRFLRQHCALREYTENHL